MVALLSPFIAACDEESSPPLDLEPEVVQLSPTEHLVRASMALRGAHPSIDDLQRVEADPTQLEAIVDGYLDTPEFGRTMRDLHNESLLLRPDWAYYPAGFQPIGKLAGEDTAAINTSVQEAPLRLVESVILEDRPYTEIVTADYAMANSLSSVVWDLPYDAQGAEWQKTRYEDGRGNAGILTDSWLYTRWQSTPSNANRQRANALSRALLCYDFLSRDVELDTDVDVSDPNAVQSAVVSNTACASCHQALDPFASFFKDVYPIIVPGASPDYPPDEVIYYPGIFEEYLEIDMREPSFFGQAGETLEDLGQLIAEDPRFSLCAAKRFYSYFNQVHLDDVPLAQASELQTVLIDSDMNAKALAKAIVLSDAFRVSHPAAESSDDASLELVGMRKARPDELASLFEDLTGFVWTTDLGPYSEGTIGKIELPRDNFLGYRVIGGGIDSSFVTTDTFTDNAASSLFLRAFAQEASAFVVTKDFAQPDGAKRKLFTEVELNTEDEAVVREQIAVLHARIYGELDAADSDQVTLSYRLFEDALEATGDPRRAWKTLLTAMMQDVRLSYY